MQNAKPVEQLDAYELWQALNVQTIHDFRYFEAVRNEYMRRLNNYRGNTRGMEFNIEVIGELGLCGGNPLYVPLSCASIYHRESSMALTLPYIHKRGGNTNLYCDECFRKRKLMLLNKESSDSLFFYAPHRSYRENGVF